MNYQKIAASLRELLHVDTVQLSVDTSYLGRSEPGKGVMTYVSLSAFVGHQHFHESTMISGGQDVVTLGHILDVLKSLHHKAMKPKGHCPTCGVSKDWPSFDVLEAAVSEAA